MNIVVILVSFALGFLINSVIYYVLVKKQKELIFSKKLKEAEEILSRTKEEAEKKKKEALIEAKDEIYKLRSRFDREQNERKAELQRLERRLLQREEHLERKIENVETREKNLNSREQEVNKLKAELAELQAKKLAELEKLSHISVEEAKEMLLKAIEKEIQVETAQLIKRFEDQAKEEAEKKSREIISTAIQRCAANHTAEATVSVVPLPNDEMKGRIIGREGRNIRMLETLTGIDIIIDDTPEVVILSAFDPIRREIARIALEKLIVDGRIHPARIEEMVEKAQQEMEIRIKDEGERAAFELLVTGLHPELIKTLGKLKFRSSYGQNILKHSIEVAYIASALASEINANVEIAKRAGLLHDIGKAINADVEGPHALIGSKLAQKYNEDPRVVHAIAAHHYDEEPQSVEAVLVSAADAISASRPGARRETLDAYIKRLEKLESIANSFEGVEKSYAIQAGREVRIIVKPEKVDDLTTRKLARDIVKKIEEEMEYPGQIKVTVLREIRAVEYAK